MTKIPPANTIIDPGAMMIKSVYTSIASIAMTTTWGSKNFTVWAEAIWFNLFKKIHKVSIWALFDVSRVHGGCYQTKESANPKSTMEEIKYRFTGM